MPLSSNSTLFTETPKDNVSDLFNMEKEIQQFKEALSYKRPLVLITGHRRVGKTSLLKSVLSQNVSYGIFMDLSNLASQRYPTREYVILLIQNSLNELLYKNKDVADRLKELLKTVSGVTTGDFGIKLEHRPHKELDLKGVFNKINEWAEKNEQVVVLAVNEAQQFRKSQHLNMPEVLASLYDNCKSIIIVLISSELGLLYDFIGKEDPKAELYGRSFEEIKLETFSIEKSEEFLRRGFEQYGLRIEQDPLAQDAIHVAAENLSGVVGWLIKFGIKCAQRKLIVIEFLSEVVQEGIALVKDEFDDFLAARDSTGRYIKIMKIIAAKHTTWNTIKTNLELETKTKIYNKNLSDLLNTLVKSGFVIKIGDEYSISDPLLRISFTE